MKNREKLICTLIAIVTACAVFTAAAMCFEGSALAYSGPQSSFEYKKYEEHSQYREELKWKMIDVYKSISGKIDDSRTIPVPGIISTYVRSDGKRVESSQYVPQGLCRAGDYILITAYDAKKKHNSVVYAIDPVANELVSTLTLPNKYHAGGIAFDGENIWITGNTSDKYSGEPFVQYMTYETFCDLIRTPVAEASKGDLSKRITVNNKPSFLEYDNGMLWVGTYTGSNGNSGGYMNGYPVVKRNDGTSLDTLMYKTITGIDSSAQGADIDGKSMYVSSSYMGMVYGMKSSFICKYNISDIKKGADRLDVRNRETSRVEVPKMNEEILVEGGSVLVNFESGAEQYKYCVIITDRVLALKKSLWGI